MELLSRLSRRKLGVVQKGRYQRGLNRVEPKDERGGDMMDGGKYECSVNEAESDHGAVDDAEATT